jgi:HK97 family phage major capsid protein
MTRQELTDKRTKLLLDAHAIMAGTTVTEEQRTNVDKMLADANILKADIERIVALESTDDETRSKPGAVSRDNPGTGTQTDNRSKDERRAATQVALRNYLLGKTFEARDLTVAADGVLVPQGVADAVVAKKSWGSVYDVVNHLRTATGEPMAVPLVNDTANLFVLNSAGITTTDPTIGGGIIAIDDIRSNPILIDNNLITDSAFDLVSFVEQAIQNRYSRTMAKYITLGNTSNVAALASGATVTGATTLVTKYADFLGLLAALDPAYYANACFVMSNTTLANQVLNVVDGNQRPIFLPFNDGGISGFSGTIFGFPVKLNPYSVANAVGAQYLMFGDFSAGYTLREVVPSPIIKKTSERYIELNKVGFIGFGRCGGGNTDAGTHPIISLIGK